MAREHLHADDTNMQVLAQARDRKEAMLDRCDGRGLFAGTASPAAMLRYPTHGDNVRVSI
jgi:hypothetical protein